MHYLLKRNYLSHSGRDIVMNSIMTVITYIMNEWILRKRILFFSRCFRVSMAPASKKVRSHQIKTNPT